jgi:tetratricopeptide (TPR) repeat protein
MKYLHLLLIVICFAPTKTMALSCFVPHGKGAIDQYEYIAQGYVIPSEKNKEINFSIVKVYKGDLEEGDNITLFQTQTDFAKPRTYKTEQIYVLFMTYNRKKDTYSTSYCSPGFSIEAVNNYQKSLWAAAKTLYELEMLNADSYKQKLEALEVLNKKLPNVHSYFYERAYILEENRHYEEALNIYKIAMAKRFISFSKDKGNYDKALFKSKYKYLFENPMKITKQPRLFLYTGVWNPMLGYGRTLYKMGNY